MSTELGLSLKRPPRFLPRSPRYAVEIGACLMLADDRVIPVTIRNLSPHGFMARCPVELARQTWLGVELPGYGIARARVRWSEDGEIGCQFRRPIAAAERLSDGA